MQITKVLSDITTACLVLEGDNLALCNELQHQCLLHSVNHVINADQLADSFSNVYDTIDDEETEQKFCTICEFMDTNDSIM